jgi:AcrR family transcriptional regulator
MSTRREELTRIAARLFAERGYQGTSLADLAGELGVQKPSLYHHIASKEDLLWEVAREGADAFHGALDAVPAQAPAAERIRLALRAHLAVVARQLDVATVFVREWRYLKGDRRERFLAERRRYEERIRDLFRDGVEGSELRTDLDIATAALLFLSAANWAYTWLRPGVDTDALADRLFGAMLEGMRGYFSTEGNPGFPR